MTWREATAVRGTGDDTWDIQFAENWDILGNTNGGYMLSIASRAASEATGGRNPVTITGHFTRPGHTGPATARTELVRSGRRFSVVRTSLSQDGAAVLDTIGTFVEPGSGFPEILLSDAKPSELPPPEECFLAVPATDSPFPPPSVGQIELRLDPRMADFFKGKPMGEPVILGWMRLKDDEPLDAHALVMASDAFPPTTFNAGLPVGWTPTLELTVHIRFPDASGWIRCEFRSRFVSGGFIEEDGLFWDEDDRLVAQSRQLALVSNG
ncbi:MAG TPA: thioesterase family protein [Acidimicrobiia bacterium]|nr:thioesterase family protein [Acidimicrobiia bacterium]